MHYYSASATLIGWVAINLWSASCLRRTDVRLARSLALSVIRLVVLCGNVRRDCVYLKISKILNCFSNQPPHAERANFNTSLSTALSSSPRSLLRLRSPPACCYRYSRSVPDEVLKYTGGWWSDRIQMLPQKYIHIYKWFWIYVYIRTY